MSAELCLATAEPVLRDEVPGESLPRRLRFLHIRKTAGTTLHSLLDDLIASDRTARASSLRHERITSRITEADRARYLYIHGHGSIDWFEEPDAFVFAFFRDPLSRFLSERRQWSQASDEDLAAAPEAPSRAMARFRTLDIWGFLDAIAEHPIAMTSMWNHQTLSMGLWPVLTARLGRERCEDLAFGEPCTLFETGEAFRAFLEAEADAILDVALAKLERLSFIGLTERFATQVPELFDHLGLRLPRRLPVLNARTSFGDEGNPGVADAIAPFIRLDEILVREACRMIDAKPRLTRSARADYMGREVRRGERIERDAADPPGGPGWHPHHRRADGHASRWSRSEPWLSFRGEPGGYALALDVYGANDANTILGARLRCGDRVTDAVAEQMADGRWRLQAPFTVLEPGLCDLAILLPTEAEVGIEVAGFAITADDWIAPPDADAVDAERRHYGEERVRGHVAFREAVGALRARPMLTTEMEAVLAFGRVAEAFCRRFDLRFAAGWQHAAGCLTAADVFAAAIDLVAAGAEAAGLAPEARQRLEEEVRGQVAQSLARLPGVPAPPGFARVERGPEAVPEAFPRGDPRATRVLADAVQNLVAIMDWLTEEALRRR
ncbi:sulfotransferase family protein [Roseomonas stagni]|uniref:Sulfotransferase family protein n=1 Tax=Falsiroseomonas algicola TaxID=2716930 RepID=A0A6M1LVQ8_9PROT|nr:sulfotransferase family 2 domain-containing protein [Falsiroseomonas algicola]NGM24072.1 sulfotransferase family protein [Falsiroseomonas algicola]